MNSNRPWGDKGVILKNNFVTISDSTRRKTSKSKAIKKAKEDEIAKFLNYTL